MASAAQDQWVEVAAAVRAHVAKRTETLPGMTIEELEKFLEALSNAMFIEMKAAAFDDDVEERLAAARRNASFGG